MKISLFIPCLVDQAAPATAWATVRLLQRLGHEVVFDRRQTCCGQALFNAGFQDEAHDLAVRFLRIFADCETIVAPSGSCVSMVKLHYADLDLSAPEYAIWESLKTRIWELSSFLVDHLKMVDVGACFNYRVGYHASCHLSRDLDVKSQPLELLRHVEGLELIEDRWEAECCGFGGVFSAKYPELSRAMADRRAGQLTEGEAQYITGADDSCLQHISQAFKRAGSMVKTIHIARILASERSQK